MKARYDLFCQMKHSSCSEVIPLYIIILKNRQCHKLFEALNILQELCRLVKSLVNDFKSCGAASAVFFSDVFKVTCHYYYNFFFHVGKCICSRVVHNGFLTVLRQCFLASSEGHIACQEKNGVLTISMAFISFRFSNVGG